MSTASPPELASRRLRAFGALIFVFVLAFALAQTWMHSLESKGPLVVGRSVSGGTGTIRPATPAPAVLPPSTAPLSASGDWVVTLPYSIVRDLEFTNNGAYVALLNRTTYSPLTFTMNMFRITDGVNLRSYTLPPGNTPRLDAARDSDVVSVAYTGDSPNCSSNPPFEYLLKFTSQQSSPIFNYTLGQSGCTSANRPTVSAQGGIHGFMTGMNPVFRWFAPSNTSGVPDASLTPANSMGSTKISGDGHYFYSIVGSPQSSHYVYDFWTAPGPLVFGTGLFTISGSAIASSMDGSRLLFCQITGSNTTRLTLFRKNPFPTGINDSYERVILDSWPGQKACDAVELSDDGKTIYLSYRDSGSFSESTLSTYYSEDGISYPLVAQRTIPYWFAPWMNVTPSGSRLMASYNALGHGAASPVQIFDRGKTIPTYLLDIPNEQVTNAAMSPDGTKVALATCSPSISPCTTARLRVYDLSLIPTGVRAEYVSNPANRVRVHWDGVSGALSYSVFRGLSEDTASAQIVASGVTGTEWIDDQVVAGQTYYYWVKSRDTLTHFFSSGAKVLIGNAVPALEPCPVEGAVLNANGTCTLTIPVSVTGYGTIEVLDQGSWSAVQNAPSGTISPVPTVQQVSSTFQNYSGAAYSGARIFFHADVPLLTGVALQSVDLKMLSWYVNEYVSDAASTVSVIHSTQSNVNTLSGSDYSHVSLLPSEVYASLPLSGIIPYSQTSFAFTNAGKSAVQAAGGSAFKFALVEGHHLLGNTFPSSSGYAGNYAYFYAPLDETTQPPVLEIVFTR